MKQILIALTLSAVLITIPFTDAQTPDANQEQRLVALIKELQAQQAQMTENEAKIETQLADVAETIRVARILAGKIGK